MQVKVITGLVAGLFAAGIAIAQSAPPAPAGTGANAAAATAPADRMARPHHPHGNPIGQLDKDKDGAISRAEAADYPLLSKGFDAADTNKDGKLSKEELQATHEAMRARHQERHEAGFKAADKNGDGALSLQEAEAAAREKTARMFERLDADKDGKLTQEEMRAGHGRHHKGGHHHKAG